MLAGVHLAAAQRMPGPVGHDAGSGGDPGDALDERERVGEVADHGFDGLRRRQIDHLLAHHNALRIGLGAEPLDLARKIEQAKTLRGPRLILALAPCPTGWDFDPQETVQIGKLAVQCGVWPLKEYLDGKVVHTKVPKNRVPVEDYLVRQGRFNHLFEPQRNEALLQEIQDRVDAYWLRVEGEGQKG